jgi:hypothetical protein
VFVSFVRGFLNHLNLNCVAPFSIGVFANVCCCCPWPSWFKFFRHKVIYIHVCCCYPWPFWLKLFLAQGKIHACLLLLLLLLPLLSRFVRAHAAVATATATAALMFPWSLLLLLVLCLFLLCCFSVAAAATRLWYHERRCQFLRWCCCCRCRWNYAVSDGVGGDVAAPWCWWCCCCRRCCCYGAVAVAAEIADIVGVASTPSQGVKLFLAFLLLRCCSVPAVTLVSTATSVAAADFEIQMASTIASGCSCVNNTAT